MDNIVLRAAKGKIQTGFTGVKARSVFFTPHGTFIPHGIDFPAIGIKDGTTNHQEGGSEILEDTVQVEFIVWNDMTAGGEEAVVGDAGVVTLLTELVDFLRGNTLGVEAIRYVRIVSKKPSVLFFGENRRWLLKKSLFVEYHVEYFREA